MPGPDPRLPMEPPRAAFPVVADAVIPEDAALDLLVEGVVAVAGLVVFPRGSADHADSQAEWAAFEARLAEAPRTPLATMVDVLHLDRFSLRCVLLAAASHVEPRLASLRQLRDPLIGFGGAPTVGLALDRFCDDTGERIGARRAFLPGAPLVRNGVLEIAPPDEEGDPFLSRAIGLSAVTVELLLREDALVESVSPLARLEWPKASLVDVILDEGALRLVRELVDQHGRYRDVLARWGLTRVLPTGRGLPLLFSGPSGTGKTLLTLALAGHAGRPLITVLAAELPETGEVAATLRNLVNEATLRDALLVIDGCEAVLGVGDPRRATVFRALEGFEGVLVLVTRAPDRLDPSVERRVAWHLPFERPDAPQRRQIWEVHLPPDVPLADDVDLDRLTTTYDFTGAEIKNAALMAVNLAVASDRAHPVVNDAMLEAGCRTQLDLVLDDLTIRESTHLRMKDIVLPEDTLRTVQTILAACRNQAVVLNAWGFGKRLSTGKGITVLFDGPPGTGKTYCAEILAGELDRPLYRINIAEVVSKWIGETEKHIRAVFQQARTAHAMLLFDEADSLFAQRTSETKGATDRYANLQVNLLLQEIERFPGVCILTTNFFGALDDALVRRIQFRVTFKEPDEAQRKKLWEVLTPDAAPRADDVDFGALAAEFELTGALVKNVLLRAAYRAVDLRSKLTQDILVTSCRDEYKSAGRVVGPRRRRRPAPRRR